VSTRYSAATVRERYTEPADSVYPSLTVAALLRGRILGEPMKVVVFLSAIATIAFSQSSKSVWDGVFSAAQAKRGGERYAVQCAVCHGDTLSGGESAPPLAGGEFLSNWNGLTVGDLFDRTRATMPQSKPGSLSREANAEIIAFILNANQFPSGKDDLPQASEVLREIKVEAVKPEKKD